MKPERDDPLRRASRLSDLGIGEAIPGDQSQQLLVALGETTKRCKDEYIGWGGGVDSIARPDEGLRLSGELPCERGRSPVAAALASECPTHDTDQPRETLIWNLSSPTPRDEKSGCNGILGRLEIGPRHRVGEQRVKVRSKDLFESSLQLVVCHTVPLSHSLEQQIMASTPRLISTACSEPRPFANPGLVDWQ
jgi:hypothetical protein